MKLELHFLEGFLGRSFKSALQAKLIYFLLKSTSESQM